MTMGKTLLKNNPLEIRTILKKNLSDINNSELSLSKLKCYKLDSNPQPFSQFG